jgi:protein PET117
MSTASKVTLLSTILATSGIVVFVHWAQKSEQAVCIPSVLKCYPHHTFADNQVSKAMHAGVVRDMEQQRIKRERQADFEMQKQLEAEYKKVQTVHDSTAGG